MVNSKEFFSNIEEIVKFYQVENAQDMVDRTGDIKQYLDTLSIDKRKVAVGQFDVLVWYFDMFSSETTMWNQNFSSTYGGSQYELSFLTKNPTTSLMSFPAWNTGLAKLMDQKSDLTLINGYQLDLFESFCKKESETWNYDTVLRQQVEAGTAGLYDFIAINSYDVIHDPSLVVSFFSMLNAGGVLVIGHTNNSAHLYDDGAEFSPYYELHQKLKQLENSLVYHDYSVMGTTIAIKM